MQLIWHKVKKKLIVIFILAFAMSPENVLFGQSPDSSKADTKGKYYIDLYFGVQVSGIRKEDYVPSNYTPYIQMSVGKWFVPSLALALNYQGPYFNFIGDDFRHNYLYLGADALLNLNSLFAVSNADLWNMNVFAGPGVLFNNFYSKTNFCLNVGVINDFKIKKDWSLKFKIAAIIGHSIYQEDIDILPNISLG